MDFKVFLSWFCWYKKDVGVKTRIDCVEFIRDVKKVSSPVDFKWYWYWKSPTSKSTAAQAMKWFDCSSGEHYFQGEKIQNILERGNVISIISGR